MKQSRILVISIMVVDLILAVVCMIAYFGEDRIRPEFRFQTDEYIYTPGDREEKLLDNITAYDDRDGDISDRIVIEKITENQDSSTIVVYYAVSDSAGNVAKISRVFVADFRETESMAEEGTEVLGGAPDGTVSAVEDTKADAASLEQADKEDTTGEMKDDTWESADDGNNDVGEGNTGDEEGTSENDTEPVEQADVQAPESMAAQEPQPRQEDRSGYPILTLRTQEVTIEAGTSPPWTEIIETLRDDKDDYATLYYNLSVSRFNRNQTGDYPVSLYTEDSDGNRSDTVSVTVHVR